MINKQDEIDPSLFELSHLKEWIQSKGRALFRVVQALLSSQAKVGSLPAAVILKSSFYSPEFNNSVIRIPESSNKASLPALQLAPFHSFSPTPASMRCPRPFITKLRQKELVNKETL